MEGSNKIVKKKHLSQVLHPPYFFYYTTINCCKLCEAMAGVDSTSGTSKAHPLVCPMLNSSFLAEAFDFAIFMHFLLCISKFKFLLGIDGNLKKSKINQASPSKNGD